MSGLFFNLTCLFTYILGFPIFLFSCDFCVYVNVCIFLYFYIVLCFFFRFLFFCLFVLSYSDLFGFTILLFGVCFLMGEQKRKEWLWLGGDVGSILGQLRRWNCDQNMWFFFFLIFSQERTKRKKKIIPQLKWIHWETKSSSDIHTCAPCTYLWNW